MVLGHNIRALAERGFWRLGTHFSREPQFFEAGFWTDDQLAVLRAEPQLTVDSVLTGDIVPDYVTDREIAEEVWKVRDQAAAAGDLGAAIALLDPETPDHWQRDGKPKVKALEVVLNRPVTAAERDDAWAKFQAQP